MFKKIVRVGLLSILVFTVVLTAVFSSEPENEATNQSSSINRQTIKYSSNQYTQPEPEISVIDYSSSLNEYSKVAENDDLELYVNEKSLAIKLINKKTGYTWSSGLDNPDDYRLNKTWKQFIQSGVTVNYLDRKGKVRSESILTNDSTPTIEYMDNGFKAKILFLQAKLEMEIIVELEGNHLVVSVPQDKIKENKYTKLVSLEVFPFFGATHQNDIPGYMFIPDGSGALIRYDKSKTYNITPLEAHVFGSDEGVKTQPSISNRERFVVSPQQIKVPVFGAVHGVNQNGFLTIIENGYFYTDIVASIAGITTDFNWITAKINYRYDYYQPTSRTMKGIYLYQDDMNEVDLKLRYIILDEGDANYVGMAKVYRNYLVENNELLKKDDTVSVRLEFLGGEKKEGLFFDKTIAMTPIKEIPLMLEQLEKEGVRNQFVIYKGWSEGGLTGNLPEKFPVDESLGSKDDLINTVQELKNRGVPLYFATDYIKAYPGASGFSSKDVAQKINGETIIKREKDTNYYYLSPKKSFSIAEKDVQNYKAYGIENLALQSLGRVLFSDFSQSQVITREETLEIYQEILQVLRDNVGSTALYEPNVYAWKYADKYLDIPMFSSNYMYETDTVPFLQIVLKGYIPYYAPFSNFSSNREDYLLRMIEYGAYPSYLLTKEASHLLEETASSDVYTSKFTVWKDEIVKQYKEIEKILKQVESATIENRVVPDSGVVEVSYSNGKTIVVNYNPQDYTVEDYTVPAKSFIVVDRK